MANSISASVSPSGQTQSHDQEPGLLAEIGAFWHQFFVKAFDPYRPELHYMRGPGPAWRAKHAAVSPAVQSMLVEIKAAKALKSSASR